MSWTIDKSNIIIFHNDTVDTRMASVVLSNFYKKDCKIRKFNPVGNLIVESDIEPSDTHIILLDVSLQQKHIQTITALKEKGAYVSLLGTSFDDTFDYSLIDNTVIRFGKIKPQSITSTIFMELYGSIKDMPKIVALFSLYASGETEHPDFETAEYVYRYIEVETNLSIDKLNQLYATHSAEEYDLSDIIELGKIISKTRSYYLKL